MAESLLRTVPRLCLLAAGLGLTACVVAAPPPATPAPASAAQAAAAPVASPAAPNVADLKDARASSGESEMESRGFTRARTQGLTAFWWHAPSRTCVRTVTANGRYATVATAAAASCGH